jgi:hypothetical protein
MTFTIDAFKKPERAVPFFLSSCVCGSVCLICRVGQLSYFKLNFEELTPKCAKGQQKVSIIQWPLTQKVHHLQPYHFHIRIAILTRSSGAFFTLPTLLPSSLAAIYTPLSPSHFHPMKGRISQPLEKKKRNESYGPNLMMMRG